MGKNLQIGVKGDIRCEIWDAKKAIAGIRAQGFALTVNENGGLAVTPASRLSDQQREMIRTNKTAILAHLQAANDPAPDPDRHCWPHTEAANTAEMSAMSTRLATFSRLGLPVDQAEKLADRLLIRDRDPADDRHLCLECQHCHYGRCGNNEAAGLRQPELGRDYALTLKRCNGFAAGNGTLAPVTVVTRTAPGTRHGHPLTPQHQAAAQEYHLHHFACPQRQGAGRGYTRHCGTGAGLWAQYQGA